MASNSTIDNTTGNPVVTSAELEGVRTSRFLSFFVDYLIVGILCIPFFVITGLLTVITFGLAAGLFAIVPPVVAVIYLAFTLGGANQATVGMRMMGIRIKRLDGKLVDPILAVLHGILFWVIHTVAVILPLFVSFFSSKKRLLHDILLGTYVARD